MLGIEVGPIELSALPGALGVMIGIIFGTCAHRATYSSRYQSKHALFFGGLGALIGAAVGWLFGHHTMEPLLVCARPEPMLSRLPHELLLAPIGGALGALAAMWTRGALGGRRFSNVGWTWFFCWGLPVALTSFLGKTTTSADASLEGCDSMGPRVVSVIILLACITAANLTVLVLSRRMRARRRLGRL